VEELDDMTITGATVVAGVAGSPVTHSLSPLIHNAWIEAAGLDAVYVPFAPPADGFTAFAAGLRGGAVRGLNVTAPFKEAALALATDPTDRALAAGAANLLVFEPDGRIIADNTDGAGLLGALALQAPGFALSGPVVILGAGGAARGAAAALAAAGASDIRIVNRTHDRADALAAAIGPSAKALELEPAVFEDACLIVNATTLGLGGGSGPAAVLRLARQGAVALDMVYQPLRTEFLQRAANAGLATVEGLAMLIGQAAPSFEAFFGVPPPDIDVRAICLAALGESA
jgi:shikimate dehydrogenase